MLKNYLIIALRNLQRNRVFSIINLAGLAVGIAASILIWLYVQNEWSYDRYWAESHRLVRVTNTINLTGQQDPFALTPFGLGPSFDETFPEVAQAVRFMPVGEQIIRYEDRVYNQEQVFFADSNVFELFDYTFVHGNPETALSHPRGLVMTEAVAQRYFGDENPMGQQLRFARNAYTVTGVVRKPFFETHLDFEMLLSFGALPAEFQQSLRKDWFRVCCYTYLLLRRPGDFRPLTGKLDSWVAQTLVPWIETHELQADATIHLQPIEDIHFTTDFQYDVASNTSPAYSYIFACVALFILLIAGINYTNLATALSIKRAREVGIRKVVGASKRQLIIQFVGESVVLAGMALCFALVLVELALPWFNQLTEKEFTIYAFRTPVFGLQFVGVLVGIMVFLGIVGGSYPAFILSQFQPIQVLKGSRMVIERSRRLSRGLGLRRTLVVLQFIISIVLIVSTIVVYLQMRYLKTKDLGFDKARVVSINVPRVDSTLHRRYEPLKEALLQQPQILKASYAASVPSEMGGRIFYHIREDGRTVNKTMNTSFIRYGYFDLLGIELVEGRVFSPDYPHDTARSFIINEAAARFLGWDDPIGRKMSCAYIEEGEVVGVVRDYNYASLHNPVEPMVLMLSRFPPKFLLLKLAAGDVGSSLETVQEVWTEYVPHYPLEYFFMDENFDRLYAREEKLLQLFTYFSCLTIVISCMGLFGLAAFTAEQRTKEIGIRKVLGASVGNIVLMLSGDFALLVLVAMVLAFPIAYLAMERWLEDFAYRIEIPVMSYLLAGFLAMSIALLTVSVQAVRAALRNPAFSLKYE